MHLTIDLDDEPRLTAEEIGDEAPNDDLPAELHAELAAAKLGPEPLLGDRRVMAQQLGQQTLGRQRAPNVSFND